MMVGYWTRLFHFSVCLFLFFVFASALTPKKEHRQDPAILTSRLIKNGYLFHVASISRSEVKP